MIKESDPHLPEQGQTDCAATAAQAMEMRADAVVLLLLAAAQALMAMAAPSRVGTFLALLVSIPMAWRLTAVFAGVVHVAIGRCHNYGIYHQLLVAVPFGLLFIAGIVVALCGQVDG